MELATTFRLRNAIYTAAICLFCICTFQVTGIANALMQQDPVVFEANLAGYNEPAPNPLGTQEEGFPPLSVVTPATGWFEVELDGNDFIMTGEFSGLKADFTGSHIHTGVAGVNGPVVVPLTPTLDPDNRGGTFAQTATVSDALVEALMAGGLYFNVHSTEHTPGEIRGQLLLKPNSPPEQAHPQLSPGFAFDFVNEGDPSEVAVHLSWDEVTDPDGDRVIYQMEAAADPDFDVVAVGALTVLNGVVFTQIAVDRATLDSALDQLGVAVGETLTFSFRVNSSDGSLRTVGEAMVFNIERGVVADPVVFEANLAGFNEPAPNPFGPPELGFPPLTVVTPATGWFEVELDGNDFIMRGEFGGLKADFTGSHIHTGVAGVNGPVVVPLTPTLDPDMRGGTFDQTATVSDELVEALMAGGLYFNVHSTAHPPGEIRGQLLLKPNSPPEQADPQLSPGFSFDFVNEGPPLEDAVHLSWDEVTDPDGDRVIYQLEAAADPDFDTVVIGALTVLNGVVFTQIGVDRATLDAILEMLGVPVGGTFTFYVRVNSSDGSLRTVGETMVFNVERGVVEEPVVDDDPPLCRIVQINPGPPAFIDVEVQDEQSGLASIEIVRDVNLTVQVTLFEIGTTEPILVRGTKIDNAARASLVIRVTDVAGNETTCDPVIATLVADVPSHFELGQNYPNPFNPSTSFNLLLPESGHVTLTVYDVTGRLVTKLINNHMEAGTYRIEWDGTGDAGVLPSGVYFYHVRAVSYESMRKMTLVR